MNDLVEALLAVRPREGCFIVGLTGGVASGKSTLAGAMARSISARLNTARVERLPTDGFLYPNSILGARGVLDRKGYPESYDRQALAMALRAIRKGPVRVPGYSHAIYDIDPGLSREIEPPDVLIVEGLGLSRRAPVDVLVYLHAEESHQASWYVSRFLTFWESGRSDPSSFYSRFADLDESAVRALASQVWSSMNLPNLRTHIAPVREDADVVVTKGPDHEIVSIELRGAGAVRG